MFRMRHCLFVFCMLLECVALVSAGGERRAGLWSISETPTLGSAGEVAREELGDAIREAGGDVTSAPAARRQIRLDLEAKNLPTEGYRIVSRMKNGVLELTCSGRDPRGLIYAAYDLAERIRHKEPLEQLNVREAPYATYRQIVACASDDTFYRRILRAMPRWRMNALMLYSAFNQPDVYDSRSAANLEGQWFATYLALPIAYRNYPQIRAMRESSPDFRRVRAIFPALLSLAKKYQVDVSLKFQILSYNRIDTAGGHYATRRQDMRKDFPHLFPGGRETPDWELPAVYQFIAEQLEELFTTYPDLAGITAASQEMAPFGVGHVESSGTAEERVARTRRMVETVEAVCAKYGKRCFWDLHGAGNTYVNTMLEIARQRPGGLRLRAESVAFEQVFADKFPSFPFERVAAAGDGMADHDIGMELNQDFPWLPNMLDRYIVRHLAAAVRAGLKGGGAMWYIYRPYYSPLNSLSAANMELLSRLLWNPTEPLDEIWNRWLRRRLGQPAVPAAAHLLRSTQEVVNGIFYFNNTNATFWFQQSGFPAGLDWQLSFFSEYFQPPGTPLYVHAFNYVARERAIPIAQMRAEKSEAVAKAQALLAFLEAHRGDFSASDFRTLLPRYVALIYAARASALLTDLMYNFTNLHIRHYDVECRTPHDGLEKALTGLERLHDEAMNDRRLMLLEPDVYVRGLRRAFLDNVASLAADARKIDRLLTATPEALASMAGKDKERARKVTDQVARLRERFERNARAEKTADEIWASMDVVR